MIAQTVTTEDPTVPCGLCGNPTRMLGTERCDGCWELEKRIQQEPELARTILDRLDTQHECTRCEKPIFADRIRWMVEDRVTETFHEPVLGDDTPERADPFCVPCNRIVKKNRGVL